MKFFYIKLILFNFELFKNMVSSSNFYKIYLVNS